MSFHVHIIIHLNFNKEKLLSIYLAISLNFYTVNYINYNYRGWVIVITSSGYSKYYVAM